MYLHTHVFVGVGLCVRAQTPVQKHTHTLTHRAIQPDRAVAAGAVLCFRFLSLRPDDCSKPPPYVVVCAHTNCL